MLNEVVHDLRETNRALLEQLDEARRQESKAKQLMTEWEKACRAILTAILPLVKIGSPKWALDAVKDAVADAQAELTWTSMLNAEPMESTYVHVIYADEVTVGYWTWENEGDYENPRPDYKLWRVLLDDIWIELDTVPDLWKAFPSAPDDRKVGAY